MKSKRLFQVFSGLTGPCAILLFCFSSKMEAQYPCLVGLESFSSGNTHGTFISPYYGYRVAKHEMASGPMIHTMSGMVKGAKVRYSYNLSGRKMPKGRLALTYRPPDRMELHALAYGQYSGALPMCAYVRREQARINRLADFDWSTVAISTLEIGGGMDLRINFGKTWSWRSSVAAAWYYHPSFFDGLDRPRMALSLGLGTGFFLVLDPHN